MADHALRLSLVIPVYNEEHHIKDCLEAVKRQTVAPFEVILVDNNSTDKTVSIAQTFPFVTMLKEHVQGRGPARSAGFDAAHGDIIGRIDADSRLAPNWVARVLEDFTADGALMGVTGLGRASMLPRTGRIRGTFWSRAYYWAVHGTFRTVTCWGANMAVRRSAWRAVRATVCNDDKIVHEDQDISLCMAAQGMKILQDNSLIITTRGQTFHYLPKVIRYWRLEHSTLHHHQMAGTFAAKNFPRLSFWTTLPGRLYTYIIGLPFLLASIVLFPVDLVMVAFGYQKTWLD